jgi:hypothetical protein
MARLSGDPGVLRWLWFSAGFRLPPENRDWVRHELTDAGWRARTVIRNLAIVLPVCAVLAILAALLLPAPLWIILMTVALIICGSLFTAAAYADDIRVTRMRQHGFEPPDDPDLGHPSH